MPKPCLILRIGGRVKRVEPRRRGRGLLTGLLAGLPRANCWTIAEHAGETCPRGMQRLLHDAVIDIDGLAGDLRDYVLEHLGDPDAVLIVDETGDLKKGTRTVGVQRQYTGAAGRIENAQVGVYLTYASRRGYAFLDRALYLPACWTGDLDRCRTAGIPDGVGFKTKPQLATAMIERAVAAGVPARWVTGDEVYGNDPALRAAVAAAGLGFVLAVAKTAVVRTSAGVNKAIDLAVFLPADAWQRLSAGDGAKGRRWYDWALIGCTDPALPEKEGVQGLLVRRRIASRPGEKIEYAFYRVHSPAPVPMAALVRVAGTRRKVEESFAGGKELAALDQHQVRSWVSWHRWTLFATLAHAFLSVMTVTEAAGTRPDGLDGELVALTRSEIRVLFVGLTARPRDRGACLAWSAWRRRHQAVARRCHYRRREARAVT